MAKVVSKFDCYEFIQWTGENLKDVIEFTGKHPRFHEWFESFEDYERHVKEDGQTFKIFSNPYSYSIVEVGNYILKNKVGGKQTQSCLIIEKERFENNYIGFAESGTVPETCSVATTLNLSPVEDEFGILPHLQKFNAEGAFDGITQELNKFCENYMSDAEGIRREVMVETSCLIKKIMIDANKGVVSLEEGIKELDKYLDEYTGNSDE